MPECRGQVRRFANGIPGSADRSRESQQPVPTESQQPVPRGSPPCAPEQRQRDPAEASIEGKHPHPLAHSAKTPTLLRLPASAGPVPRKPAPGPRPHHSPSPSHGESQQPVPRGSPPCAPEQRQRDRAEASIEGKHPHPLAHSAKTPTLLVPSCERRPGPAQASPRPTPTPQPVPIPRGIPTACPQRQTPPAHLNSGSGTGPKRALKANTLIPSRTARKPPPSLRLPASAGLVPRKPAPGPRPHHSLSPEAPLGRF